MPQGNQAISPAIAPHVSPLIQTEEHYIHVHTLLYSPTTSMLYIYIMCIIYLTSVKTVREHSAVSMNVL